MQVLAKLVSSNPSSLQTPKLLDQVCDSHAEHLRRIEGLDVWDC